ncbi:MAG: response regulator [bacterium]|nr:response regulator [bacterium]
MVAYPTTHPDDLSRTNILLVEDDDVDVESLQRAVRRRSLPFDIHVAAEGGEALTFLRSEDGAKALERLIIVLDLNMPGMNGLQFLEELRRDPKLRRLIVFVFSTSNHPSDRFSAYEKNAAGYFTKSKFDQMVDALEKYNNAVEFPPVSA